MTTPAPRRYEGNRAGLAQLRCQWRDLAKAAEAAEALHLDFAAALRAEADVIGDAGFAIPVPCLLCHRTSPVVVIVGDPGNPVPGDAMICGSCNRGVDDEVRAQAEAEGRTPPATVSPPGGVAIILVDKT
jgi:hypothetical protein